MNQEYYKVIGIEDGAVIFVAKEKNPITSHYDRDFFKMSIGWEDLPGLPEYSGYHRLVLEWGPCSLTEDEFRDASPEYLMAKFHDGCGVYASIGYSRMQKR